MIEVNSDEAKALSLIGSKAKIRELAYLLDFLQEAQTTERPLPVWITDHIISRRASLAANITRLTAELKNAHHCA